MIDVKQPLRTAYYSLLNAALTYNAQPVPVADDVLRLNDASTLYVLLSNQSGSDSSTFQTFDSQETLVLDIVFKAASRANKQAVDNVAGQILALLLPAPGYNNLPGQIGVQFDCVRLTDDRYLTMTLNSSNTVVRRLLTFTHHVRQTGINTVPPIPVIPGIPHPIRSTDFTTLNTYVNSALNGKTYSLYLNGIAFLDPMTAWAYLPGGGFTILLPNFDATVNSYEIYLLLN